MTPAVAEKERGVRVSRVPQAFPHSAAEPHPCACEAFMECGGLTPLSGEREQAPALHGVGGRGKGERSAPCPGATAAASGVCDPLRGSPVAHFCR